MSIGLKPFLFMQVLSQKYNHLSMVQLAVTLSGSGFRGFEAGREVPPLGGGWDTGYGTPRMVHVSRINHGLCRGFGVKWLNI